MKTVLDEDLSNMEPGELEPQTIEDAEGGDVAETTVDALPETECSKMRVATFAAVMDEVIEDIIEEKAAEAPAEDADAAAPVVTENDITEVTDPIVEKAVALALVAPGARGVVKQLIAKHLRTHSKRAGLYAKAAHFVAEAVTEVTEGGDSAQDDPAYQAGANEVNTPIDAGADASGEVADSLSTEDESIAEGSTATTAYYKRKMHNLFGSLEGDTADGDPAYQAGANEINTPIDAGADMDDEVADSLSTESEDIHEGETHTTAYYKNQMSKLFGSLEGDDVTTCPETGAGCRDLTDAKVIGVKKVSVDSGIDTKTAAELKWLASSAVSHRKATSAVSKKLSGILVNRMLHELRYHLPASFKKKYRVE